MKAKFSIIIPTFNSERTLNKTLDSLLGQINIFEIIIIDGLSKDGTLNIIKEYKEKFMERKIDYKYISEKDNGIYEAMNKGIKIANGDWIYFLGSDDILVTNILERICKKLKDNNSIYYGDCYFFKSHKIYDGKFSEFKILRRNICHQAIFYPKNIFYKLGSYNEKYRLWADYEFNLRCFFQGEKFEYLSELIALYNDETGASANLEDEVLKKDLKNVIKTLSFKKRVYYLLFLKYKILKDFFRRKK